MRCDAVRGDLKFASSSLHSGRTSSMVKSKNQTQLVKKFKFIEKTRFFEYNLMGMVVKKSSMLPGYWRKVAYSLANTEDICDALIAKGSFWSVSLIYNSCLEKFKIFDIASCY